MIVKDSSRPIWIDPLALHSITKILISAKAESDEMYGAPLDTSARSRIDQVCLPPITEIREAYVRIALHHSNELSIKTRHAFINNPTLS